MSLTAILASSRFVKQAQPHFYRSQLRLCAARENPDGIASLLPVDFIPRLYLKAVCESFRQRQLKFAGYPRHDPYFSKE